MKSPFLDRVSFPFQQKKFCMGTRLVHFKAQFDDVMYNMRVVPGFYGAYNSSGL